MSFLALHPKIPVFDKIVTEENRFIIKMQMHGGKIELQHLEYVFQFSSKLNLHIV